MGNQLATICKHPECRDPITGDALPAQVTRTQEVFCGFKARYFSAKEEPSGEPKKVIQLMDK